MEFRKWLNSNVMIHYEIDDSGVDNGVLSLKTKRGNHIGSLWFSFNSYSTKTSTIIHVDSFEVSDFYQGREFGTALLKELIRLIPLHYPNVRYITADATSQGVVRLMDRVLGTHISQTGSKLPNRSPEDWINTDRRATVKYKIK